jgi:hypothetical protein
MLRELAMARNVQSEAMEVIAMKPIRIVLCACAIPACSIEEHSNLEQSTTGSGSTSTLIGRGTFAGNFQFNRTEEGPTGEWEFEGEGKGDTDVIVQKITFQPGGHSGWHSHPGPVWITVLSGTMTFYDSDDPTCTPIVRSAGQGFLDGATVHAHIARNETGSVAENLAVVYAPSGQPFRFDAPAPGNCPF